MRPQQWVNTGPDEGASFALLARIEAKIPPAAIDEVWLFPNRRTSEGDSTVIVAAAFDENSDRRRVVTFRFVVIRNNRGAAKIREQSFEYGSAPSNAIVRVIEGVLRRLGDETEVPPHGRSIQGDVGRWSAWLAELGAPAPEPVAPPADQQHDDATPAS